MIRMNDFLAEPEELRHAELAAFDRVVRSGTFILGREVEQFERAWAEFCGTGFCAGVGNGLEAIELGLRALGIGPGDEVITTPMTAVATILAILHAGATPVFADIDPATALLNPAGAEQYLSPRTKAVLLVHLYGQLRDIEHWQRFCGQAKIHLLEDCAQAHGASWNGQRAGSFGTWGAFSFYPTKNLGAKGDAGALVTNSSQIAGRVKALRNCGASKRDESAEAGLNSRLDELQAAFLSARLDWLARFNDRRREIASMYFAQIANLRVQLLAEPAKFESHVYHLFVIRSAERDRLAGFLKERGIATLVHYPVPAHRHRCCDALIGKTGSLPNAEAHAAQCLSIPCHPQLRDDDVTRVVEALNQFR